MKKYQKMPIIDCGELLIPIPFDIFALEYPHPYEKLGADYGGKSPYYLREGVVEALKVAQQQLQKHYPGWRLKIFDAYRPVEVQQFMVDYTFKSCVLSEGLNIEKLSPQQKQAIYEQVYQMWAIPSLDPKTPPPHSTGGAVDLTLIDAQGNTIDMGGEIDELSPHSHPDYYSNSGEAKHQEYHFYRQLLNQVMLSAGFQRHPSEWWHFCSGEQMWAWLTNMPYARYGRI